MGALGLVARNQGVKLGEYSLDAEMDLIKYETSFHVGVRLKLNAPELGRETAETLLRAAHEVCPIRRPRAAMSRGRWRSPIGRSYRKDSCRT